MGKGPSKQELKANLRGHIEEWFIKDPANKYSLGNFYRVSDAEKKIVKHFDKDDIKRVLIKKATILSAEGFGGLGDEGKLWPVEVHQIMQQLDALMAMDAQESIVAVGDSPISGDYSERPYVINRLPVDFGLPQTIAQEQRYEALAMLMEKLPPFYHDLKSRMASHEMWDVLTCFLGRVISEDKPSPQMLYWYGEGGDGKGELSDLFFRNMGDTATPMSFGDFHSRFGGEPLIDRRFIRIDEVPKGNFMTDRVKEFTGGNKTLLIERKGKPHVIIKSRLAFMFTSNNKPSFDGSMAQKRRLRYIESLPRTDKARDVQSELDASFDVFLAYCLINYARHGLEIPENDPLVLADLTDDTMSPIDYWIKTHLEYAPGANMTNDDIRKIMEAETPFAKFSLAAVTKRLPAYFDAEKVSEFRVESYRENDARRTRGWRNVQPKNRFYGGINFSLTKLTEAK